MKQKLPSYLGSTIQKGGLNKSLDASKGQKAPKAKAKSAEVKGGKQPADNFSSMKPKFKANKKPPHLG